MSKFRVVFEKKNRIYVKTILVKSPEMLIERICKEEKIDPGFILEIQEIPFYTLIDRESRVNYFANEEAIA